MYVKRLVVPDIDIYCVNFLARMGNQKAALQLIIEKLQDVDKVQSYVCTYIHVRTYVHSVCIHVYIICYVHVHATYV